jgi:hypothetical protein
METGIDSQVEASGAIQDLFQKADDEIMDRQRD